MSIRFPHCVVIVIISLAPVPLSAHDFWLAAANWTPAAGTPVTIKAGHGERFPVHTEFRPRRDWFEHWQVIGPSGEVPVTTRFLPSDLVMTTDITLPSPGAYLGVMHVASHIEQMTGPDFTEYLKEEGLDRIIAARRAAGVTDKPVKELYARYAKVALRNGAGSGAHLTRPVGLKAEFVPMTDPTSLRAGQSLTVQLLAEGQPIANAIVSAVSDDVAVKGETDADGRVTLKIEKSGAWLIRTVHMVPLTGSPEVEWESYWVTLSFHTSHLQAGRT